VVALVTGHGLKTVEALADSGAAATGPSATIAPTLAAFDAALAYEPETETKTEEKAR
jgi:hypothetical protein